MLWVNSSWNHQCQWTFITWPYSCESLLNLFHKSVDRFLKTISCLILEMKWRIGFLETQADCLNYSFTNRTDRSSGNVRPTSRGFKDSVVEVNNFLVKFIDKVTCDSFRCSHGVIVLLEKTWNSTCSQTDCLYHTFASSVLSQPRY